jgi:hypothetical protein
LKIWLKTVLKEEVKMAKKTTTGSIKIYDKVKVSRPGIHSKTKSSKLKSSKNYKKRYNSQGK